MHRTMYVRPVHDAARHADRRAARHRPVATIAMLLPITFTLRPTRR
jgi:hypothetical protein